MSPGLSTQRSREPEEGYPGGGAPAPASTTTPDAPHDCGRWYDLVDRIRRGEDGSLEELYSLFARGVRFYLCRQLGSQDLEDKVHDTFLVVVHAIRRGELREPDRLMSFVRTVVRRQVATCIGHAIQTRREFAELEVGTRISDHRHNPERTAIDHQNEQIVETVLRSISPRDREILTRFYLLEQTQEQICDQMQLSDTQFRLLKSRAKARFGQIGKRRLARRRLL